MVLVVEGRSEFAQRLEVAALHRDGPLLVLLADAAQQFAMLEIDLLLRNRADTVTLVITQHVGRDDQQHRRDHRIVRPAGQRLGAEFHARGDDAGDQGGDGTADGSDQIYISIPEDNWDEFARDFSVQVYNNKADYKRNSLILSALLALLGGVATYFISGHALRPIREFSEKIEEVQAQNLADSRIEENKVKELNQLRISYNKMLERLADAFEIQRQFTANAAHELRTPLSVIQVQLDLYHSTPHPGNDADTLQTLKMVTEQNGRLSKMVKTLLDMSELQTVSRDETIAVDALVDEVLVDLEPLAQEKEIKLIGNCKDTTMVGSDILIYRMVYNLVENAIKYNHFGGQVTVTAYRKGKSICLSVEDTGSGIPAELKERIFEPFFRVDKSRSRQLGGVGLGLALVREIVRVHDGRITVQSSPSGGTIFEVVFTQ